MNTIRFTLLILAAVTLSRQQSEGSEEPRVKEEGEVELENKHLSASNMDDTNKLACLLDLDETSFCSAIAKPSDGDPAWIQLSLRGDVYCVSEVAVTLKGERKTPWSPWRFSCNNDGCNEITKRPPFVADDFVPSFDMAVGVTEEENAGHEDAECEGVVADSVRFSKRGTENDLEVYEAWVLGELSEKGSVAPVWTLNAMCDDEMTLYIDAEAKSVKKGWKNLFTSTIPTSIRSIGIQCLNRRRGYGIMASIQDQNGNDILVTDNTWSCSNTADAGWEWPEFEESDTDNWKAASYNNHKSYTTDKGPWAVMSKNRHVIWTANRKDKTVYCRKMLG